MDMGRRWWVGPGLGWPGRLGWAGPLNFYLVGRGPARPGPSIFQRVGRGPARPSPSHFQKFTARPGPARPIIFSNVSARPDPAHHMAPRPMKHGLYMDRPDNYVGRPVDLTGRPMCCSVPKRECTHYAGVNF